MDCAIHTLDNWDLVNDLVTSVQEKLRLWSAKRSARVWKVKHCLSSSVMLSDAKSFEMSKCLPESINTTKTNSYRVSS